MGYISNFKNGLDTLEAEYNKLEKKYIDLANEDKPKALIPYKSFTFDEIYKYTIPSKIDSLYNYCTEETIIKHRTTIIDKCNVALEEFREINLHNQEIIKYNQSIVDSLKQYMSSLGIPESRLERDYKSRARYPKSKTVASGYLDDIRRYIPVYDSEYNIYRNYCTSIAENITKKAKEYIDSISTLKQIRATEEAEKKKNFLVTKMIIKYELPDTSSASDVFWHIVNKDMYLRLAHYMSLNRGDWSDGCDYTETGLAGFSTNTPQDEEIFNEISELCEDWKGDGRVFRDCEWNYSRIFELADKDLYKDYTELYKMENFE